MKIHLKKLGYEVPYQDRPTCVSNGVDILAIAIGKLAHEIAQFIPVMSKGRRQSSQVTKLNLPKRN